MGTIALNVGTNADIQDYSSLIEKIRMWLDRDDLDAIIPTFILLTESYLNRKLRTPEMEAFILLQLAEGQAPLPEDFLELRFVRDGDNRELFNSYAATPYPRERYQSDRYTLEGQTLVTSPRFTELQIGYWQRIPALSESVADNWLIAKHPDVYLFGALAQAGGYIDDPRQAQTWASVFETLVQDVIMSSNKARHGGPIQARVSPQVRGVRA